MLIVENVKKKFNLEAGLFAKYGKFVYAINDISFKVYDNEIYGLVGESGCGKTTMARLLVQIYNIDEGKIIYKDKSDKIYDYNFLDKNKLKELRTKIKYIFQDPAKTLNPRMSIYSILTDGLRYGYSSKKYSKEQLKSKAINVLKDVGLSEDDLYRRPQDFSGGQRQRISIARALMMEPEFLICDEVVSALDVSIQSQILNLLHKIRKEKEISIIFIAHDLTIVTYFCDRIGVMYRGEIVEEATSTQLMKNRFHPYTELLYSSIPEVINFDDIKRVSEIPPVTEKIEGCSFYSRCPQRMDICKNKKPENREIEKDHFVKCFLYEK